VFDATKFRAMREAARIGQGRAATALGIQQSGVARMESPDVGANPTAETLSRFAALYGCSVGDFFTESPEERALRERGKELGENRPARGPAVRMTVKPGARRSKSRPA